MIKVKDITIIAVLATILFVQELALSLLPNIQLTVLFIVVYTKVFGLKNTVIIVIIHTLLDNLIWGFNILHFSAMLMGWLFIPLTLGSIFKNVEKPIVLALLGIIYALIYSWSFAIAQLVFGFSAFVAYLTGDILFEIILAASSFVTILWLYEPLSKVLLKLDNEYFNE